MTALRFEADGEKLSLEPTLNRLLDQDGDKRRHASEALAKVFKENVRLFTLITNTLAKDKEISDRWRGFVDVADSAISPTGSRRRWSMRSWLPCARLTPASHTAITP